MAGRATQERTLGAILGLGIGDALGMPVAGLDPATIRQRFGRIEEYHGLDFEEGVSLAPGEFTDETEIALCIMETYTSANGVLDPELIRARMQFLSRGESRRWMSPETRRSLEDESEPPYRSDAIDDPEVALRGIAIGLIHAAPEYDRVRLQDDVAQVVGLTHGRREVVELATVVAEAMVRTLADTGDRQVLLGELGRSTDYRVLREALGSTQRLIDSSATIEDLIARVHTDNRAVDAVVTGIAAFVTAVRFEDAVFAAATGGGETDSRAALSGALSGAHFGAGGIPQLLIDRLEGRIYLTLAAPWFYRTIQLMTGRGISMGRDDG
ncbi:MAG: ADP-ribosylglycohydrolase family protein, partial [Thermomicrobiales bacterium]|nr:ADP-ribosylglycohydrolase family protein [Thermomicrobiales bacterium]MCO5221599.1 ADP-ribosylglycohydrolase family protein [Thermomicrobiales bacterium]